VLLRIARALKVLDSDFPSRYGNSWHHSTAHRRSDLP
jgi:hypothetical protein